MEQKPAIYISRDKRFEGVRVLVVTPRFYPLVGGQEVQAERIANLFTSEGAVTTVLTEMVNEIHLTQHKEFSFTVKQLQNRRITPFPRLSMFFKFLAYYITNARKFDLIIVRTFSVHSLALGLHKRIISSSFQSIVLTDSTTEVPALSNSVFSSFYRYVLTGNDFINAISPEVSDQLKDFNCSPDKIKHIPNLLEISQTPDYVTVNQSCRRFVYVGNIAREKGVFDLILGFADVCKEFMDISLDIYGIGDDKEELSKLVIKLKTQDSIRFHGVIPNEELGNILKSFDCLIYPSHNEGFGLVPFEAAAFPMKIIATRVGVLEKYLRDRCIFIDTNDPKALSAGVRSAHSAPDEPTVLSNISWKELLKQEMILNEFADMLNL